MPKTKTIRVSFKKLMSIAIKRLGLTQDERDEIQKIVLKNVIEKMKGEQQ